MRSKENGRILTLIRSIDHHFYLTLQWFGNRINITISDHRIPSSCLLDVQEASKLTFKFTSRFDGKENIFRKLKFKF